MTMDKKKVITTIAIAVLLVVYLVGYVLCRATKVFVHTACVLNIDFHGRYHMVHVATPATPSQKALGYLFWPLRETEAWLHCLRG